MARGWNKGLTKETDTRVKQIAETMRVRQIDNFKSWRDAAKDKGLIKSTYPLLEKNGDVAELIGVVLGDGNITAFPRCECLRITGDATKIGFVFRSRDLIASVFNKQPTIRKVRGSNAMTVSIYEKHISNRLGIPSGSRARFHYSLPGWIKASRDYRIRFLRGLYEAEGSLCHHAPTSTHKFLFKNMNIHLLTLVHELVTELGFTAIISSFQVQVSRMQEVQNLSNLLRFRHYDT